MSTVFKTAQEYAQELANPPQKTYAAGSEGTTPSTLAPSGSDAGGLTSAETPPDQQQPAQTGGTAGGSADILGQPNPYTSYRPRIPGTGAAPAFSVRNYVKNPGITQNYAGLFAPLTKGTERVTKGLQTTTQQFGEAAGPRRTYEGIGAQGILEGALTPGGDEAKALADAQSLVNARYGTEDQPGPMGLDQDTLDKLYGQSGLGRLQGIAGTLGSGIGIENAIRSRTPGLTPGELHMGSRALQRDTGFQTARRGVRQDIGELAAQLGTAQQEATDIGKQRVADEADIAQKSRGYVTGRQDEITNALNQRVQQEIAYNQALQDAYDTFKGTGSVEDFSKIPGAENLPGFQDLKNDKIRADYARAQAAKAAVDKDFQDIKDVPLLEAGISSHGFWDAQLPKDWMDEVGSKLTPAQLQQVLARARERQAAMAKAGFGNFEGMSDQAKRGLASEGAQSAAGEFSAYNPLFDYGTGVGDYQLPDLREGYVTLKEGVAPTMENQASSGERYTYNRASDILGDAGKRLEEAKTPYERKSIAAEIGRLLDDEEKQLAEREETLSAGEKKYLDTVRKARRDYRAAKRRKKWNRIIRIVSDVALGGGLPEIARKIPVVKKIPEELTRGTSKLIAG